MSRLVKIVDNKYVQIEEYKNPNICFNTNEYNNFEDYCTLRETFDPFEIFYENQELKKQLEEYKNELGKADSITQSCIFNGKKESEISYRKCLNILDKKETQQKEFIKYLEDEIKRINPKELDIGELNLRLDDIKFNQYLIHFQHFHLSMIIALFW